VRTGDRDLRLLFAGLSVSMAGDSLMLLVFAIWVKSLTGSNGAAASVMLCVAVPFAVSPLGGWLVDRVSRRRFLVSANLLSGLMLLPLLAIRDRGDIWIIYVVAVLYGVSMVATGAAINGILKELLDDDRLAAANGALHTVREGLRLGGPLAGAVLFATLGGAAVALIDAATFLAAAGFLRAMRVRDERPEDTGLRWQDEVSAGLRHVMAQPVLRRMMAASALAWLVIGLGESVGFAVVDEGLHRPPEFIGVLSSAQGAGCLVGGLIGARLIARFGELAATGHGLCLFGIGSGLCTSGWLPGVLAGKTISGTGFVLLTIGFSTVLQRMTPAHLLGRVSTAAETLTSGPQLLSIAVGAALISAVDYRLLLLAMATGALVAAALLWTGDASRHRTPRPEGWRARASSRRTSRPPGGSKSQVLGVGGSQEIQEGGGFFGFTVGGWRLCTKPPW
jgi:MFS family permease